jgi:pimeloyl-ACP methyl ester carboxylesterase
MQISPAICEERYVPQGRGRALYDHHEKECLKKGWQRLVVTVEAVERKVLWKAPEGSWKNGAIIALHGGGGTFSNFGSNIPIGKPMVEFGDLAIREGFAVISPESTFGLATDREGRSSGKRWDCIHVTDRKNVDLPFLHQLITEVIPDLRPAGSAPQTFVTGVSNGGFMAILFATHFPGIIIAFAPVSAGDPYGTYMDMGTHPPLERKMAPGVFRDNETHKLISAVGAAVAEAYANETEWPDMAVGRKPPFRQFYHLKDGVVDVSLKEKATRFLVEHGYHDDGSFVMDNTANRTLMNHFWQSEYNLPLIEYFKEYVRKNTGINRN